MSMCTLCVFPAFGHRQSRVETPSTIRKALQSNALLPFHNTAAPRAAVPMAMSPPILFLCQRLLAPVFIFLSSSVPQSERKPLARELFQNFSEEAKPEPARQTEEALQKPQKHPLNRKAHRDASEGIQPTIVVTRSTKKQQQQNLCRVLSKHLNRDIRNSQLMFMLVFNQRSRLSAAQHFKYTLSRRITG